MQNYNPLPPLVENLLIHKVSQYSTAQLCDGMKELGCQRDGCMDASLSPIKDNLKMIGTACTVETQDGDNFPIHVALYQCRPGYVLVVDGKGCTERPYVGDLMCSTAKAIGLSGIVVNGYVRDKSGLKELNFPVYSKGYMQRGPLKKGPGKINVPILCAGVVVQPGDLVVGDCDGVTVIPRDRIEDVLVQVEKKATYESERRHVIEQYVLCRQSESPLPNLMPDWVSKML